MPLSDRLDVATRSTIGNLRRPNVPTKRENTRMIQACGGLVGNPLTCGHYSPAIQAERNALVTWMTSGSAAKRVSHSTADLRQQPSLLGADPPPGPRGQNVRHSAAPGCRTVPPQLTEKQLTVLRWIADDCPGNADVGRRTTARHLSYRDLVTVKGRGDSWQASITAIGRHYLEHGGYPPGHVYAPTPEPTQNPDPEPGERTSAAQPPVTPKRTSQRVRADPPSPKYHVDSPKGARSQGESPRGDALFSEGSPDPWDEKVLISVKEAAWLLSLPEGAIRQAVTRGDLERVFIGEGQRNYRVVYGSLLAWVNDMPRESPSSTRWSPPASAWADPALPTARQRRRRWS